MKCCICRKEIEIKLGGWDKGNNAEPVKSGRCCDVCNDIYVIPARMALMMSKPPQPKEQK